MLKEIDLMCCIIVDDQINGVEDFEYWEVELVRDVWGGTWDVWEVNEEGFVRGWAYSTSRTDSRDVEDWSMIDAIYVSTSSSILANPEVLRLEIFMIAVVV